jgi:hypothetical protein
MLFPAVGVKIYILPSIALNSPKRFSYRTYETDGKPALIPHKKSVLNYNYFSSLMHARSK